MSAGYLVEFFWPLTQQWRPCGGRFSSLKSAREFIALDSRRRDADKLTTDSYRIVKGAKVVEVRS